MMNVGNLQQLPIYHGTVVFVDVKSSNLPHGKMETSPRNVFLALREGAMCLVHAPADGGFREIRVVSDSALTQVRIRDTPSDSPEAWLLAEAEEGAVGLFKDNPYLCAEKDRERYAFAAAVWRVGATLTAETCLHNRGNQSKRTERDKSAEDRNS